MPAATKMDIPAPTINPQCGKKFGSELPTNKGSDFSKSASKGDLSATDIQIESAKKNMYM